MERKMRGYIVCSLVALASVLLMACSEPLPTPTPTPTATPIPSPTSTPTPSPTLTPTPVPSPVPAPTTAPLSAREIALAAADAMEQVETLHFDMYIQMKVVVQGMDLDVPISFVGDFQAPDLTRGMISISMGFFVIEFEVISIGDTTFSKDPETGEWVVTVGEDPFFTDPGAFVGVDASEMEDLAYVGTDTLDGVEVYRLKGAAPPGMFSETGGRAEVTYWIGVDDNLLRQVIAEGDVELDEESEGLFEELGGGTASISVTLRLSEFGKSVSIEAPDIEPTPTPMPTQTPTATHTATPVAGAATGGGNTTPKLAW